MSGFDFQITNACTPLFSSAHRNRTGIAVASADLEISSC
jgi:hypothetical protein